MKDILGVMSEKLNNSYHPPGTINRTADRESRNVSTISTNSCGLIARYLLK